VIGWSWDSAARGTALGGVVMHGERLLARQRIEEEMRRTGALSALAQEVLYDGDEAYEPTGAAMIAQLADPRTRAITWRDVRDTGAHR
jgi:hypothetical protein